MRSFIRKFLDKLKLCCCYGITDEEARLIDEAEPIIVRIRSQPELITVSLDE